MTSDKPLPLITGEIVFEEEQEVEEDKSFSNATLFVRLSDVSLLDTSSKVIAQQIIKDVSYQAGSKVKIDFILYGEIPDKQASYAVSVHVDIDGDGEVSLGDYINMESYPVLSHGYPNHVSVKVRQIK